jgi:hypothetical protein
VTNGFRDFPVECAGSLTADLGRAPRLVGAHSSSDPEPQVQMGAEIVAEQVAVGIQGERGGVMAHPALEAQRAGASVDEHRRAGVAQRVKAHPRNAGALRGRYEHAVAQIAGPQRRAPRKSSAVSARQVVSVRNRSASSGLIGIVRRPCRDLGAVSCPLTIALRTCTHGASVSSSASMTRRPIASEMRRPVEASSSNSGRDCGGISATSRASCCVVRKRRSSCS